MRHLVLLLYFISYASGIGAITLGSFYYIKSRMVQVNSSNTDFAVQSLKYLIKDKVMWAVNIGTIAGLLILLYTPMNHILKLSPLKAGEIFLVFIIAAASVLWYEIVKMVNRISHK